MSDRQADKDQEGEEPIFVFQNGNMIPITEVDLSAHPTFPKADSKDE